MSQPANLAFASLKNAEKEYVSQLAVCHTAIKAHPGVPRNGSRGFCLPVTRLLEQLISSAHPSDSSVSCSENGEEGRIQGKSAAAESEWWCWKA